MKIYNYKYKHVVTAEEFNKSIYEACQYHFNTGKLITNGLITTTAGLNLTITSGAGFCEPISLPWIYNKNTLATDFAPFGDWCPPATLATDTTIALPPNTKGYIVIKVSIDSTLPYQNEYETSSSAPSFVTALTTSFPSGNVIGELVICEVTTDASNIFLGVGFPSLLGHTNLQLQINELKVDVLDLENDTVDLQADVAALQSDTSGLKTDVATLKTDSATLKIDVTQLKTNTGILQTTVAGLVTDTAALQADVTTLQSNVTALQAGVTALQNDVTTLQNDTTTLQANFTSLQADVTALQNDNVILKSNVISLQTTVANLQTTVAGLVTDTAALQADNVTLKADVVTIKSDIVNVQGDITTLQTDVTTMQADILNLQNAAKTFSVYRADTNTPNIGTETVATLAKKMLFVKGKGTRTIDGTSYNLFDGDIITSDGTNIIVNHQDYWGD